MGDYENALIDFTQCITLDPQNMEAHLERANVYAKQRQFALALADYNKIISIYPTTGITYRFRGEVYFQMGNKAEACADWKQAQQFGEQGLKETIGKNCGNE